MLKGLVAFALTVSLVNVIGMSPVYADSKEEKQARFVERVKEGVHKLGVDTAARVEVKLRDQTKLKGYISEMSKDYFVVVDSKTRAATTIAYPQVQKVKGHNLSSGAKIAIEVALVVGLIVLLGFLFVPKTSWLMREHSSIRAV